MEKILKAIKERLTETGLPIAYRSFPEKEAPELPYLCYYVNGDNVFYADGEAYWGTFRIKVELYIKQKDCKKEETVEKALSSFLWTKSEEYLEDEDCYQITYEMEA